MGLNLMLNLKIEQSHPHMFLQLTASNRNLNEEHMILFIDDKLMNKTKTS